MRKESVMRVRVLMAGVILCTLLIVAGCFGQTKPDSTGVARVLGEVTLAYQGISAPVVGAIVSVADKSAITDARGTFEITEIKPGRYQSDVRIPVSSSGRITASAEMKSPSSARVWSGIVNVTSTGNTVLPISIQPLAELLRFGKSEGESSWQIAFYACPPADKTIVDDSFVMTPNQERHNMSPHFLPQWHCFWNTAEPEEGIYVHTVRLSDGSIEVVEIYMTREMFTGITLPELVSPEDNATLDTATPYLEYCVPNDSEVVYVRIKDMDTGEEVCLRNCPNTGVKVPEDILAPGKQYMWRVHIVNKPVVLPWIESLTAPRYFTIRPH